MSTTVTTFAVANWVSLPAPWRVDQPPAAAQQKWLIILSGVAIVNVKGTGTNWLRDSCELLIDMRAPIQASGRTPSPGKQLAFKVEQWAPFATINAIFDQATAVNAGFAVDKFRPLFSTEGQEGVTSVFGTSAGAQGRLEVDVAVRDIDAWLYRIGYQITLVGRLVEFTPVIIP